MARGTAAEGKKASNNRACVMAGVMMLRGVAGLEMIPETPNDAAVTNQRTFVRDSCKLFPGRAKSIMDVLRVSNLKELNGDKTRGRDVS